jgi:GDP-D-mannose dehydratase
MKGDASYAREKLDWKAKVAFPELVRLMVEADMACVGAGR